MPILLFFSMGSTLLAVDAGNSPAQRIIIYLTDAVGETLRDKSSRDKKLTLWSNNTGLKLTFIHERTGYSWVIAITPKQDKLQIAQLIRHLENDKDVKHVEVDKIMMPQPLMTH